MIVCTVPVTRRWVDELLDTTYEVDSEIDSRATSPDPKRRTGVSEVHCTFLEAGCKCTRYVHDILSAYNRLIKQVHQDTLAPHRHPPLYKLDHITDITITDVS